MITEDNFELTYQVSSVTSKHNYQIKIRLKIKKPIYVSIKTYKENKVYDEGIQMQEKQPPFFCDASGNRISSDYNDNYDKIKKC